MATPEKAANALTAEAALPQAALLRLLAVLGLVLVPHFAHMPAWAVSLVIALLAWRTVGTLRQWPLPHGWLRGLLVLAAFVGIQLTYGRMNGQYPGAALLAVMVTMKLTEMRARRDVLVVVTLCYFLLFTHFLFSQELWTILYLIACGVAVTAVLIEANHPGGPLAPRRTLRMGAAMVLQAAPLMLVFFVLFPRIPGPLWGLPSDAGAARTGISDTMSPGDIARLIESDEIAFRVQFEGEPPPMSQRYWRGPVFWYFDGRRWRAPFNGDDFFQFSRKGVRLNAYEEAEAELLGGAVAYEITLEPHRQNWLFALDVPDPAALPGNTELTGYYQLLSRKLVREPKRYRLVSHTRYRLEPDLAPSWQRSAMRLPADVNPRAAALARSWRAEGLDDVAVIHRALQMFREQEFHYTLSPPRLGDDMVDEFLFETRRGFCEHYASSFTVLMRAAGLPARVVVGYQGGELNAVGDYFVVRQSDAHAWTEVWLPGQGWRRVDPTAAVAPNRIEAGISAALEASELPGFLRRDGSGFWYWRLQADVAWDWVNVMWDRWVIGFNPERQLELLSRFGVRDWTTMVVVLTVLVTASMALVGMYLLYRMRPAQPDDSALLLWTRALRRLDQAGFRPGHGEGPRDFVERLVDERPGLAPVLRPLLKAYLESRYYNEPTERNTRVLAAQVEQLPAALKG